MLFEFKISLRLEISRASAFFNLKFTDVKKDQ